MSLESLLIDFTNDRAIVSLVYHALMYRSGPVVMTSTEAASLSTCVNFVVDEVDAFTLRVFSNESVALAGGLLLRREVSFFVIWFVANFFLDFFVFGSFGSVSFSCFFRLYVLIRISLQRIA